MKSIFLVLTVLALALPASGQFIDSVWVKIYNGPGNGPDIPNVATVDIAGNVYVAGEHTGGGGTSDYIIIKYRSDGSVAWTADYDAVDNGYDYATDIFVDAALNVYVTGSVASGSYMDYCTIKYDSLGNELWVKTFDGPGGRHDNAYAITVDNSGNVFITGMSYGGLTRAYDIVTIKYLSNGDTAWVKTIQGSADTSDVGLDIDVDMYGDVYIAGAIGEDTINTDWLVQKYYSDGTPAWTRYLSGTANENDSALVMVVTDSGDVYVAGNADYTSTGSDFVIVKYDRNGNLQWQRISDGGNNLDDYVTDMTIDNDQNILVCGKAFVPAGLIDMRAVKYNSAGMFQWGRKYNAPANLYDGANAVACDTSGNVYITGYISLSASNLDMATIKYSPDGDREWVRTYGGEYESLDDAGDIAVDKDGNVYITGYESDLSYMTDIVTIRYSIFGPLYVRVYSPINVKVTDPAGYYIGKDADGVLSQTLFPADYFEEPPDYIDEVVIYFPIAGEYIIDVIAETGAPPDATYSIGITVNGSLEEEVVNNATVPASGTTEQISFTVEDVPDPQYVCGDANGSTNINILDVTFIISYLYKGGQAPDPIEAGDANGSGGINILDVTHIINYLYKGGEPPVCPQ